MRIEVAITNLFTNLDKRCHRGIGKKGQTLCSKCARFDGNMLFKSSVCRNLSGGHGNPADLARNEILYFLQVDL